MSLRRQEGAAVSHEKPLIGSGHLVFQLGHETWRVKMDRAQFDSMLEQQRKYVVPVCRLGDRNYWLFRGQFFWDNENLCSDEVHALLVTRHQRQRQQIDLAQQMVSMGQEPRPTQRGAIPDDVKQFVWMRDGGRCRRCGSAIELQFDHVIPVSMGGSSAPENLQILCGPCNRRKGAAITVN